MVHDAAGYWVRHVLDGIAIKVLRRLIFFVFVAHQTFHSVSLHLFTDLTIVNVSLHGIIHYHAINIAGLLLPVSGN